MISISQDLAFSISVLSRFVANPDYDHWTVLTWVIAYIVRTLNVGMCYGRTHTTLDLVGYVDADFAGDQNSWTSTTSFSLPWLKVVFSGNLVCNA